MFVFIHVLGILERVFLEPSGMCVQNRITTSANNDLTLEDLLETARASGTHEDLKNFLEAAKELNTLVVLELQFLDHQRMRTTHIMGGRIEDVFFTGNKKLLFICFKDITSEEAGIIESYTRPYCSFNADGVSGSSVYGDQTISIVQPPKLHGKILKEDLIYRYVINIHIAPEDIALRKETDN